MESLTRRETLQAALATLISIVATPASSAIAAGESTEGKGERLEDGVNGDEQGSDDFVLTN